MSDIENENEPENDDEQIEGVEETKDNISESEEEEENDRNEDEDDDVIVGDYEEEELPEDESVQDEEEDEQTVIDEKMEDAENQNNALIDNGYQGFDGSSDSDSDESDSESEDDEYVSKVDLEKKMEYIKETHTQEISKTYEEMIALTKIRRKKNKTDGEDIIVDEKHTTVPILTKYEKTRILGIRVSQLNEGAPRYINVGNNQTIIDNNIIAEKELRMKKLPFIVTRPLPSGETEHWRLKDLEIL